MEKNNLKTCKIEKYSFYLLILTKEKTNVFLLLM